MTHPRPTHPPSPSTPGPSKPNVYPLTPRSFLDAARAWGRVALALAELTVSIARGRAM